MTQLDKTEINIVGEINQIPMQIATDPRIQVIDMQVADIFDAYGTILGREFTKALNGYTATDLSHMWLPWKGLPNNIRIEHEPRMKYMITKYNNLNEVLFAETYLGNYHHFAYQNEVKPQEEFSAKVLVLCSP